MTETRQTASAPPEKPAAERWTRRWLFPLLRIAFLVFAAWLVWYTAGHWDRWTGAARFESTDDAFMSGDVTPLSARVSGYITEMPVNDFQTVRKGDLIAEIDPSDYRAQLDQAEANLAAAQATLANLANQKDVQRALVRQAEATIEATEADLLRYQLEAKRQRDLLQTRIAGTQAAGRAGRRQRQAGARATAAERSSARPAEGRAGGVDVQEKQLKAQIRAAEAQVALARRQPRYTRIVSPADGLVGQRQVRLGQFVNVGTQVIAVVPLPNIWVIANYKETQMTNVRIGQPRPDRGRRLPGSQAHGPRGQLVAGDRKHVRAAAARQRHRQLHQGGAARSGEDRPRPERVAWIAGPARHVGRGDHRHRRAAPARTWAPPRAPRRHDRSPRPARRGRAPRRRRPLRSLAPASPLTRAEPGTSGSAPIRSGPISASLAF